MKKLLSISLMMLFSMAFMQKAQAQSEFFKPYASTDLRLPSVPLITSDPFLSIWSPYDKLTDGTTRHWTNSEKPITGLLRVDGVVYRFMGHDCGYILDPIAPMADTERWEGVVSRHTQTGLNWTKPDFKADGWKKEKAAWGSEGYNISSGWHGTDNDIYIRRNVELTADQLAEDLYIVYSHDDCFELYINGTEVVNTGETWLNGEVLHLEGAKKALLHAGKNIISAHCHNTTGGQYADFGLFRDVKPKSEKMETAEQKSADVLATSTYYTFTCGPVELDLTFTAPMIINDYDLLSAPMNYISYQVRSTDGAKHNVQFYLGANTLMGVNQANQPTVSKRMTVDGIDYVRTGTIDQRILATAADAVCIDWGYFYMPAINGQITLAQQTDVERQFCIDGTLVKSQDKIVARKASNIPALAYVHDFGNVESGNSFTLLGYDEIDDIQYMFRNYKAYWAHEGKVTIFQKFKELQLRYAEIMTRCREFDKQVYDDGMAAGGKEYAEILSGSYRHVIAAHKLFKDDEGHLLFFSKENNSNGCVNTVDLTYPSAPIFLIYNPELEKAMMTSVFELSYTDRWTKPFANHDLGTYPQANGQRYGDDMPIEESGNMLTLAATLCMLDGNTKYVDKYWDIITTWAEYLSEKGMDPENQLCTDDFAGHWAHNCNLSLKAICGVAGYGLMAQMKGDTKSADKYLSRAREMAKNWEQMADDGDHYRLAFDREGTWSQKYNVVWDKLWNLNLFSKKFYDKEIKYYLKHQNKYGLPLDSRKDYTKSDWIMWTASMAADKKTFEKFVSPLYTYINETKSRVPISDWSETKTGYMVGFKARSVIGGYWMRVFADKMKQK
ncbi:MAG: DUF4965 domain-containing protein [Prevotellaceae bacterium]|nr:DUF4965 domain-containing protein [Prevotellaceae bacterium]